MRAKLQLQRESAARRSPAARSTIALCHWEPAPDGAHGYLGTFDPDLHEFTGPQLVTFVDSKDVSYSRLGEQVRGCLK